MMILHSTSSSQSKMFRGKPTSEIFGSFYQFWRAKVSCFWRRTSGTQNILFCVGKNTKGFFIARLCTAIGMIRFIESIGRPRPAINRQQDALSILLSVACIVVLLTLFTSMQVFGAVGTRLTMYFGFCSSKKRSFHDYFQLWVFGRFF